MTLPSWKQWLARAWEHRQRWHQPRHQSPQRRPAIQLAVELLTDRLTPATFNIANGDVAGLIAAINAAQLTAADDTIELATDGTYTFTAADNAVNGANALPAITVAGNGKLLIEGNGATLTRSTVGSIPEFRFFVVTGGDLTLNDLTLTNGIGTAAGGALRLDSGKLTLDNVTVSNNSTDGTAKFAGGGLFINGGTAAIDNSKIINNTAANTSFFGGGGIYIATGTVVITNTDISGNSAKSTGGGLTIDNGNVTITNSTLADNVSLADGGGIFKVNASLTINNSVISNNKGNQGGGVSWNSGLVIINDTTISGNEATGLSGGNGGGGIFFQNGSSRVNLSGSLITGNKASNGSSGGGMLITGSSSSTITNSTISGNTATADGGGLSVQLSDGATLDINNSTITNNRSNIDNTGGELGGGIKMLNFVATPTVTLTSTIVAGNFVGTGTTANDVDRTAGTGPSTLNVSNSLIQTMSPGTIKGTDSNNIFGQAPLLSPLADNGGPTLTHALLPGSPALNKGSNPLSLTTDQRGQGSPRQVGTGVDIGAYELTVPTATLSNNGPVTEGNPVTVSFTNPSSPSTLGTTPFHYSYALNAADLATTYAAAGTSDSAAFTLAGGSYTVHGRIFAKDGGAADYTTVVTVTKSTVTFSMAAPVPATEGNDLGTTELIFTVTRAGNLAPAASVAFTTRDGTALAGIDYVLTSGTLNFAANQTTATIAVPIIGNTVIQGNRTFTVALSNFSSPGNFAGAVLGFAPEQTVGSTVAAKNVAVGDFNGDGRPDLALPTWDATSPDSAPGSIAVLLNTTATGTATPNFAPQAAFGVGVQPRHVEVADINDDDLPDLIAVNFADSTVSVLLNTTPTGATTPTFAAQLTFATGAFSNFLAIGDINGDLKPDLVVSNFNTHKVAVLLNSTPSGSGTASFASHVDFDTVNNPMAVVVGEFNGDGNVDIAAVGYDSNVSVLLNTTPTNAASPTFAPQQSFAAGGVTSKSVAVGDFNGDGLFDLAVAHYRPFSPGSVSVLLNTTASGTLNFAAHADFDTGGDKANGVVVADFNGDGRDDLAVSNRTTQNVTVLLGTTATNGTVPTFTAGQVFAANVWLDSQVTAVDLNGDNWVEAISASFGSAGVLLHQPEVTATGTIQDDDTPPSPVPDTVVPPPPPGNTLVVTVLQTPATPPADVPPELPVLDPPQSSTPETGGSNAPTPAPPGNPATNGGPSGGSDGEVAVIPPEGAPEVKAEAVPPKNPDPVVKLPPNPAAVVVPATAPRVPLPPAHPAKPLFAAAFLRQQLDSVTNPDSPAAAPHGQSVFVPVVAAASALTVGYVLFYTRAAFLLLGALGAGSAWRELDPLAFLEYWEQEGRAAQAGTAGRPVDRNEARAESMFD